MRGKLWIAGVVAVIVAVGLVPPGAAAAATPARIEGTGSPLSVMDQWSFDLNHPGPSIVIYTPTGATTGRSDFRFGVKDFAVSDIPYQGADPLTGQADTPAARPFMYVPFLGTATAFPYQL